jgi:hypothetical protein
MFLLKLEDRDLDRLKRAAQRMRIERAARLAFLNGLRQLENNSAKSCLSKEREDELNAVVLKHWETKDDCEIGRLMSPEVSCDIVRRRRYALGLQKKGPHAPAQKRLNALIKKHWKRMSDTEIGRLVEPHVSRGTVVTHRLALGLKRPRGSGRRSAIRKAINCKEFERMVLCEGYTMTEYLQLKKLHCSRERLRQIVEELGLKHSPEDRAPQWELQRRARKVGNLNLANREWLAKRLARSLGLAALAAQLGVDEENLTFFVRKFGLTHPSFRKHGVETVDLVCTQCGKGFKRLRRWVDQRTKSTNGKAAEFFCCQSCSGLYNRKRRQQRARRQGTFIRKNWRVMSDSRMGKVLKVSAKTVGGKRYQLKLHRSAS